MSACRINKTPRRVLTTLPRHGRSGWGIDMTTIAGACARATKKYPNGRTGTSAGYLAHRKVSEAACQACMTAQAAATAVRRGSSPDAYAAYRSALADYRRRIGVGELLPVCAKPSPDLPNGRTGTRSGYQAHCYADEPSCAACLEGNREQVAADRIADPELTLRANLASKYNLSIERYKEMLREQGGKCAICRVDAPTDVRTERFHVDHDHACCPGRKSCGACVRGLLCHACNTALGNFKDNPEVLAAAISYLTSRRKEPSS